MIDLAGKRVFLSGRMSDDPATYHAHEFLDAHIALNNAGALYVYNPAIQWLTYDGEPRTHEDWMQACISEIIRTGWMSDNGLYYDILVSLPKWENSVGACLEREVAELCGMPCVDFDELFE